MSAKKLTTNEMVPMEEYQALVKENRELLQMLVNSAKIHEQLSGLIEQLTGTKNRVLKPGEKVVELWASRKQQDAK